jgi:hypothetical protein
MKSPRTKGRLSGRGIQGLRMCAILDELRSATPAWVTLDSLVERHGVCARMIRFDLEALASRYPIHRETVRADGGMTAYWIEAKR